MLILREDGLDGQPLRRSIENSLCVPGSGISRISRDELMEAFDLTQKKLGVMCASSFAKAGGVVL
jgi:hypothetical protein